MKREEKKASRGTKRREKYKKKDRKIFILLKKRVLNLHNKT